jgi:hypothetical protein
MDTLTDHPVFAIDARGVSGTLDGCGVRQVVLNALVDR